MAKASIAPVSRDFDGVLSFLQERGMVKQQPDPGMLAAAKRMHAATYSLILWRFRLGRLPDHSRVFIEEIASDALQLLPQALAGYVKTADLLIRGIIENTVRHVYFTDHPIEFLRMNRDSKWYMDMKELFDYPSIHPILLETEPKFNAVSRLKSLYTELSGGIHGRKVRDLEMRAALRKIVYDQEAFDKRVSYVEQCAAAANFIIATLNCHAMHRFSQEDQRILLRSMSDKARKVWRDLE